MLISRIDDISPDRLTLLLKEHGLLSSARVTMARVVSQTDSPYAQTASLLIHYDDVRSLQNAPRRAFLKLGKPNSDFGDREIVFYQQFAPAMLGRYRPEDLPVLRCYVADYAPETGQSLLLLEDISEQYRSAHDGLPPSPIHYEKIVESLAHVHGHWWQKPQLSEHAEMPSAESLDALLTQYQEKYETFKAHMTSEGRLGVRHREILETVTSRWPPSRRDRLVAGEGVTLIHGDTHPKNFMYGTRSVKLADWQSWRAEVGTDDLAYFIACFMPDDLRRFQEKRLLQRYYDVLGRLGVRGYSWDECWQDYRMSVARVLTFLLMAWKPIWVRDGRWARAEKAMSVFDELDVMALYG